MRSTRFRFVLFAYAARTLVLPLVRHGPKTSRCVIKPHVCRHLQVWQEVRRERPRGVPIVSLRWRPVRGGLVCWHLFMHEVITGRRDYVRDSKHGYRNWVVDRNVLVWVELFLRRPSVTWVLCFCCRETDCPGNHRCRTCVYSDAIAAP